MLLYDIDLLCKNLPDLKEYAQRRGGSAGQSSLVVLKQKYFSKNESNALLLHFRDLYLYQCYRVQHEGYEFAHAQI